MTTRAHPDKPVTGGVTKASLGDSPPVESLAHRRLLSSTVLYGFGDLVVLASGAFFLLPLYARRLTQDEFGIYVITKTNTEILTYLLQFGLISAVSRLYFDYKKSNQHYEYLSSILLLFGAGSALFVAAMALIGRPVWHLLSPAVPVSPYLWFCLSIAVCNFFGSFASIWLRAEERVGTFVAIQIASAILLVSLILYVLVDRHLGLLGLLSCLVASAAASGLVLPFLFRGKMKWQINAEHVRTSIGYAVPIVVGYFAYFVLNRAGTLVLQHHVSLAEIAVFGLGQQLGNIVTLASNAFAKSLQPMVFAADPSNFERMMERASKLYLLLILVIVSIATLFASEILRVVGSTKYATSFPILIILLVASFLYSYHFVFDTALLYVKRPMTSVGVSLFGGACSVVLNMALIPHFGLIGAAVSTLLAFGAMLVAGYGVTRKVLHQSQLGYVVGALVIVAAFAGFAIALNGMNISLPAALAIKGGMAAVLLGGSYVVYLKGYHADA